MSEAFEFPIMLILMFHFYPCIENHLKGDEKKLLIANDDQFLEPSLIASMPWIPKKTRGQTPASSHWCITQTLSLEGHGGRVADGHPPFFWHF